MVSTEDEWQTQRQGGQKTFSYIKEEIAEPFSFSCSAGHRGNACDQQLTWVLGSAVDEGLVQAIHPTEFSIIFSKLSSEKVRLDDI